MAREKRPDPSGGDEELGEFVPAVFARSLEEAEEYRQLLDDHDIPAIIGDEDHPKSSARSARRKSLSRGVPVLVPEAMLEEAGEVIAERDETDAFGLTEEEDEEEEDEVFALDDTAPAGLDVELGDDEDEEEDEEDDEDEEDELDAGGLLGEDEEDEDEDDDEP